LALTFSPLTVVKLAVVELLAEGLLDEHVLVVEHHVVGVERFAVDQRMPSRRWMLNCV